MVASAFRRRAATLLRPTAPLLAMLGLVSLAACDDGDGVGPGSAIAGTYVSPEGDEYLRITSDEIRVYSDAGVCYLRVTFDIVARDADEYTIELDGERLVVEITRSGDQLTLTSGTGALVYQSSNVDVSELEICDEGFGEFDPALEACTSYPTLTLGTPVNGALSSGDATDASGYHFDAYRLQLANTSVVDISLSSVDLDSYLYVYSAGGTLVAENDDGGAGFDSFLSETLSAGCYIVVASSFDPAETGAYTLIAE